MLHVKTYLDKSHGIGLFAGEQIAKGTVIWSFHPNVDWITTVDKINELVGPSQDLIRKYMYWDTTLNALVMCGDDARHMNHSDDPSCSDVEVLGCTTARRDIQVGEELTCNYADLSSPEHQFINF